MLRRGKVLGRFDIRQNKIDKLLEAVETLLGSDCMEASHKLLTESESKVGVF